MKNKTANIGKKNRELPWTNNIYVLYYNRNPATAGLTRINTKERQKKKAQVRRAKRKERDQGTKSETLHPSSGN